MLVGTVLKERTDHSRVTVDFSKWLDAGETIKQIVSQSIVLGMSGWSNTAYPDPWYPPPDDPTPLVFELVSLINGATAIQVLLDDGTPGNSYTVTFVVHGLVSNREVTAEVGVQVAGNPPVVPQTQAPPILPPYAALPITGGTLTGALYLSQDPQTTMEPATRRYVDAWVVTVDAEIATEIARATAAEATFTNLVTQETTRAITAESALNTQIGNEATTRTANDNALGIEIANEATARLGSDADLGNRIANETAARVAADADEASQRAAGDAAINTEIANEITIRATNDGSLNTAIGNEATARLASDADLGTRIDNEATARLASDAILGNNITALGASTVQVRSGSLTTNPFGQWSIAFSPAFPNAVIAVTAYPASYALALVDNSGFATPASPTGATGMAFTISNSPVVAASVSIGWIATGF